MTQLDQLKALLQSHHLWAKKSLGQNFLVDEKAMQSIVDAAELTSADNIVEVGPGTGFLTEKLIEKVAHVTAIELDVDMIRVLEGRFGGVENLEVINEDVLKFQIADHPFFQPPLAPPKGENSSTLPPTQAQTSSSSSKGGGQLPPSSFQLQTPSGSPKGGGQLPPSSFQLQTPSGSPKGGEKLQSISFPKPKGYKVVANIPYYITSPLIKHFLHSDHPPSLMVLLLQKEVAEKICGKGGKTLLSVQIEVFGQPELVAMVQSHCFYPAPKVDSAILRIRPYSQPLVAADRQKEFFRLVQFGYSQKRKKLSNTLAAGLHLKSVEVAERMRKAGIDPDLRAEHLGVGEWVSLTNLFK